LTGAPAARDDQSWEVVLVWRPTMFLLCLIAALSGTPLRQAEAASDFARTHAELQGGQTIEEIDGGVGDDSGATIRSASVPCPAPALIPLMTADGLVAPFCPSLSPPLLDGRRTARPLLWLEPSSVRLAWLARFLF
jgi:hypothetical protein